MNYRFKVSAMKNLSRTYSPAQVARAAVQQHTQHFKPVAFYGFPWRPWVDVSISKTSSEIYDDFPRTQTHWLPLYNIKL